MSAPPLQASPASRRILLVVDCYMPSEKSAAALARDLAEEFAERGHPMTVLVPSNTITLGVEEEHSGGVTVIRYKVGKTKDAHHIIRAINEMTLSLVAWLRCRRRLVEHPPDLVIFYSPSIFFGPLVRWLKRRTGAETYLVLRDIFPDWAVDTGVLKKGLVYRVFKVFERLQYRAADAIGVEAEASLKYFQDTPHAGKVEVLRNWTTIEPLAPSTTDYRSELGLQGKVVFFYGGNIGVAQDMDNLMRLAQRMTAHEAAHFLIVGSGSEVERLKQLVAEEQRTNVTILPAVDQATYLSMLQEFDVGLISLDKRLKSCNYPGKLLGYLRCGMPVLASINPGNDLVALLERYETGLASVNGDDESLYLNASRLCDSPLRTQLGRNAEALLHEVFSVSRIAEQILRAVPG